MNEENGTENKEENIPGDTNGEFSSPSDSVENLTDETGQSEKNQTEQAGETDTEDNESGTEEPAEGEPVATAEPSATPESYVLLIEQAEEINGHLETFETYAGALFAVLGVFLGVYLIHDLFESLKKL